MSGLRRDNWGLKDPSRWLSFARLLRIIEMLFKCTLESVIFHIVKINIHPWILNNNLDRMYYDFNLRVSIILLFLFSFLVITLIKIERFKKKDHRRFDGRVKIKIRRKRRNVGIHILSEKKGRKGTIIIGKKIGAWNTYPWSFDQFSSHRRVSDPFVGCVHGMKTSLIPCDRRKRAKPRRSSLRCNEKHCKRPSPAVASYAERK